MSVKVLIAIDVVETYVESFWRLTALAASLPLAL